MSLTGTVAMSRTKKTASGQERTSGGPASRPVIGTVLKLVGGVTAVLSLVFGLTQLVDMVSGHRQRDRQVKELLRTSGMEQQARDYSAAWNSLEEADRLTKGGHEVRTAQESLAMDWLENVRLSSDQQRFSDVVGKVTPVLDRAASTAQGVRKADLLAHLGWAEFLRSRDGVSAATPDHYYQQALKIDPQNAYAHAMLGHWILWNGGRVSEAREQFSFALAAGPRRDCVRALQLSGYENVHTGEARMELIRVVNDMRKNGEPVDPHTRSALWIVYDGDLDPQSAQRQQLLTALPPEEQLATFGWLFDTADFDSSRIWIREFYRAILQEAAGQRAQALQTLLSVRAKLPYTAVDRIRDEVQKGIVRLSKTK
jgi:hypothetical protein